MTKNQKKKADFSPTRIYKYKGVQLKVDRLDYTAVAALLHAENTAMSLYSGSFCDQGVLVESEGHIMTLAAALCPHSDGQVVRPKDGDWFNLTSDNLVALAA